MGIYFFLKGIRDYKYFIWSSIFMGIDMFTYHSAKVITPLVLVGLVFIFRKELLKINFKKLVIPGLIFLIFFGGLLYTFKIGGGGLLGGGNYLGTISFGSGSAFIYNSTNVQTLSGPVTSAGPLWVTNYNGVLLVNSNMNAG